MPDTPQDAVEPGAASDPEAHLPWYKRTPVIIAVIGALVALTGTFAKAVLPRLWHQPPGVVAVRGRVTDAQAHALANAKVSLEGKDTPPVKYTDPEGIFTFDLPDDVKKVRIRVEATGYDVYWRWISVFADGTLEDIQMKPQAETTAQLWGYVRDRDEHPLAGARVWLEEFPGLPPAETATDGGFWIKDIPRKYGEVVRVRAVKDGYQPNPCIKDTQLGGQGSTVIYLTLHPKPSTLPC